MVRTTGRIVEVPVGDALLGRVVNAIGDPIDGKGPLPSNMKTRPIERIAPEVLRAMTLKSNGFDIEPEMTAKIFKRGYRVYEVPITYDGRGYEEGKKITWKDGVVALWVLLKYRFTE